MKNGNFQITGFQNNQEKRISSLKNRNQYFEQDTGDVISNLNFRKSNGTIKRGSLQDYASNFDKNFENINKQLFLQQIQVQHENRGASQDSQKINLNQYSPLRNQKVVSGQQENSFAIIQVQDPDFQMIRNELFQITDNEQKQHVRLMSQDSYKEYLKTKLIWKSSCIKKVFGGSLETALEKQKYYADLQNQQKMSENYFESLSDQFGLLQQFPSPVQKQQTQISNIEENDSKFSNKSPQRHIKSSQLNQKIRKSKLKNKEMSTIINAEKSKLEIEENGDDQIGSNKQKNEILDEIQKLAESKNQEMNFDDQNKSLKSRSQDRISKLNKELPVTDNSLDTILQSKQRDNRFYQESIKIPKIHQEKVDFKKITDSLQIQNERLPSEEFLKKNQNELEMENYIHMKIFQPVSQRQDDSKIQNQFPFIKKQTFDGKDSNIINDSQLNQNYRNSSDTVSDKKRLSFKPSCSIYGTNNSLEFKNKSKNASIIRNENQKDPQIVNYNLRFRSPSRSNILSQAQISQNTGQKLPLENSNNQNLSHLQHLKIKNRGDLPASEIQGGAPENKLSSVSSQYRRQKGTHFLNKMLDKQRDIKNNMQNLSTIDQPYPHLDDQIRSITISKKMCQRGLRNLVRNKQKTQESMNPQYLLKPIIQNEKNIMNSEYGAATFDSQLYGNSIQTVEVNQSIKASLDQNNSNIFPIGSQNLYQSLINSTDRTNLISQFGSAKSQDDQIQIQKQPVNISYMCIQMKERNINEQRLQTQKNTVRQLDSKYFMHKKLNKNDISEREYLLRSLLHKQRLDSLKPNDKVANGGYEQKYSLAQNTASVYQARDDEGGQRIGFWGYDALEQFNLEYYKLNQKNSQCINRDIISKEIKDRKFNQSLDEKLNQNISAEDKIRMKIAQINGKFGFKYGKNETIPKIKDKNIDQKQIDDFFQDYKEKTNIKPTQKEFKMLRYYYGKLLDPFENQNNSISIDIKQESKENSLITYETNDHCNGVHGTKLQFHLIPTFQQASRRSSVPKSGEENGISTERKDLQIRKSGDFKQYLRNAAANAGQVFISSVKNIENLYSSLQPVQRSIRQENQDYSIEINKKEKILQDLNKIQMEKESIKEKNKNGSIQEQKQLKIQIKPKILGRGNDTREKTIQNIQKKMKNLDVQQDNLSILKSFNNPQKSPNFILGIDDVITNSRGPEDIASSIGRNNFRIKELASKMKSPLLEDTTLCQQDSFIQNTKREQRSIGVDNLEENTRQNLIELEQIHASQQLSARKIKTTHYLPQFEKNQRNSKMLDYDFIKNLQAPLLLSNPIVQKNYDASDSKKVAKSSVINNQNQINISNINQQNKLRLSSENIIDGQNNDIDQINEQNDKIKKSMEAENNKRQFYQRALNQIGIPSIKIQNKQLIKPNESFYLRKTHNLIGKSVINKKELDAKFEKEIQDKKISLRLSFGEANQMFLTDQNNSPNKAQLSMNRNIIQTHSQKSLQKQQDKNQVLSISRNAQLNKAQILSGRISLVKSQNEGNQQSVRYDNQLKGSMKLKMSSKLKDQDNIISSEKNKKNNDSQQDFSSQINTKIQISKQ